uniref:Uncharacterized protein n=1 Tax=Arundo donax TaxID=35708 RepID=A0A0A8YJY6_ARUDO
MGAGPCAGGLLHRCEAARGQGTAGGLLLGHSVGSRHCRRAAARARRGMGKGKDARPRQHMAKAHLMGWSSI